MGLGVSAYSNVASTEKMLIKPLQRLDTLKCVEDTGAYPVNVAPPDG